MKADDLFSKTTRGQAEIETRSHGLSVQYRRLLILVNGTNTVGALEQLSLCDNTTEILAALIDGGFIEARSGANASKTVAAQDYALN